MRAWQWLKLGVSFDRRLSNRVIKIMCDADRRNELIDFYGREGLKEVTSTIGTILKKTAPAPTGTVNGSQL